MKEGEKKEKKRDMNSPLRRWGNHQTKLIVTMIVFVFFSLNVDYSSISLILMCRSWTSWRGGNGRKVHLVEHVPTRHSCG